MSNITTNLCNQMSYNHHPLNTALEQVRIVRFFLPDIEIYLIGSTANQLTVWQYKLTVET